MAHNVHIAMDMAHKIKEDNLEHLGFICTGSSGAILATIISLQLTKPVPVFYLRKENESGHSHYATSFFQTSKNLIFIDDFIGSGATVNRVIDYLKEKRSITKIKGLCLSRLEGEAWDKLNDKEFFEKLYIPESDE